MPQPRVHVRAVDGTVAARRPTRAPAQIEKKGRVIDGADENSSALLILRMASQAKVRVGLDEHLFVDRTVRVVTSGATFAQRFVLEHHGPGLLAVTRGASLVEPRHRQPARGFENVAAVRVVALHAVHAAFGDGMMLRQIEFSVRLQMALKTRGRVFARIDDELAATAAGLDVQAARPVTRLAPALSGHRRAVEMHPRVRARREHAHVIRMALETCAVADVSCPGDFGRGKDGLRPGGTGVQEERRNARGTNSDGHSHCALRFHY
jgi:hypothetical protein